MATETDHGLKKLEKEYSLLIKRLSEFESIRREMMALTAQASSDPLAKKRLDALQAMLPQYVDDFQSIAKQELKKLKNTMRQFDAYLKESFPSL